MWRTRIRSGSASARISSAVCWPTAWSRVSWWPRSARGYSVHCVQVYIIYNRHFFSGFLCASSLYSVTVWTKVSWWHRWAPYRRTPWLWKMRLFFVFKWKHLHIESHQLTYFKGISANGMANGKRPSPQPPPTPQKPANLPPPTCHSYCPLPGQVCLTKTN